MIGKIIIFILRQNKSIKRLKVSTGKTEFTFKKGKYYLQDRGCFLKGRRIYALYFENIPNPIAFDNLIKLPVKSDSKTKEPDKNLQAELTIDSTVIKDMTEKDFLNALTQGAIEKLDMLYLVVAIMSIILSIGCLYYINQVAQAIGL